MESRLEKIFSMGINIMSLAVWLGEDRKFSAAVVGLDLLLGLSIVRRCSLNRSFKKRKKYKQVKSASLNFHDSASTALLHDYHKALLDIINCQKFRSDLGS